MCLSNTSFQGLQKVTMCFGYNPLWKEKPRCETHLRRCFACIDASKAQHNTPLPPIHKEPPFAFCLTHLSCQSKNVIFQHTIICGTRLPPIDTVRDRLSISHIARVGTWKVIHGGYLADICPDRRLRALISLTHEWTFLSPIFTTRYFKPCWWPLIKLQKNAW